MQLVVVRGQRVTVEGDQQPTGELYGDLWTKVATATHQGFIEGSWHLIDFKLLSFCLDGFIFRTLTYPWKLYCYLPLFYSPLAPTPPFFLTYPRHPQQQNDQILNHGTTIVLITGHGFTLEHTFCRPDEIMLLVSFACH